MMPVWPMAAVVLLMFALSHLTLGQDVVVTVNPDVDNSECVSAQQLLASSGARNQSTCRTVNHALGNVSCGSSCTVPIDEQLNGVLIRLEDGKHRLTECLGLWQAENVVIEAVNPGKATLTCTTFPNNIEDNYDNFYVCTSSNVTFRGIRFEECGPTSPSVYLNSTTDVTFEGCTFYGNKGTPLQFQSCTGIRMLDTEFLLNDNSVIAEPDVNETNIEDLYRRITTSGGLTFFSQDDDLEITIHNCSFISNSANRNDPNNSRPVLLKENGHGGALLIRLVESANARITISDCTFTNNSAQVDGGAIYIFLSDGVSSSFFWLQNNTFTSNNVEQASGGAVSVNSFNFTYNNSIIVEDCEFMGNTGNAGGAFSVALYNSNLESTRLPDEVNFTRCGFYSNKAENEGTAVGLFSLVHVDQIGFPVSFTDCNFMNNTSLDENEDTSAIAAFRFPTIFSGSNSFVGNIGGGITLLNTRMEASGSLWFEANRAVFGGGIAMDDRCLLEISSNTTITFLENVAEESGAGIYVEFPPIRFVVDIFNRLCFLQYRDPGGADVPPQDWVGVEINFVRNIARLSGAAIFASDMQQCSWLGNDFTTDDSLIFIRPQNLSANEYFPFTYVNNTLMPEGLNVSRLTNIDLGTSPSMILLPDMSEFEYVQPGETVQISLLATDQVDNSREAVWSLEAPSSTANLDALSANNNSHPYVVPRVDDLPGITVPSSQDSSSVPSNFSSEFTLTFSLLRTLGTVSTLNLTVNGCHPGYHLDMSSGQCVCDNEGNTDILRCDDNNRYLYLREGIWGTTGLSRELVTARVQPGYVNCDRQGRLQGCRFVFDQEDKQCRDGRRGQLCGQCAVHHAVTLDLQDCMPTPCTSGLAVFLLLCVGIVVGCLVVLIFDLSLPNELKGFFFYAQVIGLVYRPYQVVQDAGAQDTRALSVFLNLLGFSVPIPLCLSENENFTAHYVALLGYIPPILALLTIIGYVIAAQFIGALGKHSALKAITFISLFVYKYVADTAFVFISCLPTNKLGFVFQYDGSVLCNSVEFIIFGLIGLLLVISFVIPIPFFLMYICRMRPLRFQHYADVLTEGLKAKHRWWGGWDLGRRLPFIVTATFIVFIRPSVILFIMSLVALLVLLIHVFTKPFKKMYINVIEAAILLNLLMVTAAFLDPSNSPVPFEFSTILVLLPYFYAVGYVIYRIGYMIWRRVRKMKQSSISESQAPPAMADKNSLDEVELETSPNTQESNLSNNAGTAGSSGTRANTINSGQQPKPSVTDSVNLREPLLED